jgi:tripartite-type tricarboxylate transporter receptor subunit TctC
MTIMLSRRVLSAALLALLTATPARAQQDWPDRPVTVVVPFAAGGSTDAVARILAQQLSTDLGQQFLVDNRAGAVGTIGFAAVARAEPDGYMLGLGPGSTYAMAPHLYRLPYDAERAFVGIGPIATMPMFMVVPRDFPARTLPEFLELAKRPGSTVSYAHAGVGSSMHLAVELFLQVAGIEVQGVSYRGAAPAIQGLFSGDTQMTMPPASAVMAFIKSGDVRAIAVSTKERSSLAPDVPTVAEQGFPDYEVLEELALVAPAGTPEPILRRLNQATAAAFANPEVQQRLAALAVTPAVGRVEDWPAYITAENRKWREVIRTRNITLQ